MEAQNNLGILYHEGMGVEQDYRLAFQWYQKAAEQGHALAKGNIGNLYRDGNGVEKSRLQAIYWYLKADRAGYKKAQSKAETLLKELINEEKSLRALEQVELAVAKKARENELAAKRKEAERKQVATPKCNKDSLQLFSTPIDCVRRDTFRATLKTAGNRATRENDSYFADLYDSSQVLSGTSELSVLYIHSKLAYAEYTFPRSMDTQHVQRVVEMLAAKYGKPTRTSGRARLGPVTYVWEEPGGISVQVNRGWPDTTIKLRYVHNKNNNDMLARVDEIKKAERKQKHEAQSDAF